jgi:hypothetical protein
MALTTVATASQVEEWDASYFAEYVRNSGFSQYMGRGMNMPICAKYELTDVGKAINIPLVTRLTGSGVSGQTALEGAEESLGNYNHRIEIEWYRNGVAIPKNQAHYTEMDLRAAAREQLTNWAMNSLRDDIIAAMQSVWNPAGNASVAYGSATEEQKDAWLDNNLDRVLFGSARGNVSTSAPAGGATNDHSASLLNVDTTSDKLDKDIVSLMKRIAKTADPHIRPMRVNDRSGREYFILFCGSLPFRDLKSSLDTVNIDARPRNVESNPVFQDGDLVYDGVIIREVPEIPVLSGVGNSSSDVAPIFLCGAQAVGVAWGQEPRSTTETRDYGFVRGVGIEEARGVEKIVFNDVDHGMVTGFVSAPADS